MAPQFDTRPRGRDPFLRTSRSEQAACLAGLVRVGDVPAAPLRWLWPGRIPLGRVTLLVGDPGLGKSLVALDIAARVSRAAAWPDEPVKSQQPTVESQHSGSCLSTLDPRLLRLPSSVLLLTAEDDLADTVRPRLEAAGADCSKILTLPTWGSFSEPPGGRESFSTEEFPGESASPVEKDSRPRRSDTGQLPRAFALNRDLARLRHMIEALPDCRLLVIDPITAYLGRISEHASAQVQSILVPLAALARTYDVAVLVTSHLRRKASTALYRPTGSIAFVAAARAAWALTHDCEPHRCAAAPGRRLLVPLKNNHATRTGLAFTIQPHQPSGTPVLHWSDEPITISPELLIGNAPRPRGRPNDERQDAVEWLQQTLANGPRLARDLKDEAEANGIGYGTLRRAFRELGGKAVRQLPHPFAPWMWKLPLA